MSSFHFLKSSVHIYLIFVQKVIVSRIGKLFEPRLGCVQGTFGAGCTEECHCAVGGCNSATGRCAQRGCSAGWIGENCQRPCEPGTWGLDCEEVCGECLDDEPCDRESKF